jgi:hypothetical protein
MTQRCIDGGFSHWRTADAVYFVTWRLAMPELSTDERDLVTGTLRHFDSQRYELLGYVVLMEEQAAFGNGSTSTA